MNGVIPLPDTMSYDKMYLYKLHSFDQYILHPVTANEYLFENEKSQLFSVMSCQYFFILLSCSQYQMSQYSYRLCEPLIVPCIENNCLFFVCVFFWGGGGGGGSGGRGSQTSHRD